MKKRLECQIWSGALCPVPLLRRVDLKMAEQLVQSQLLAPVRLLLNPLDIVPQQMSCENEEQGKLAKQRKLQPDCVKRRRQEDYKRNKLLALGKIAHEDRPSGLPVNQLRPTI